MGLWRLLGLGGRLGLGRGEEEMGSWPKKEEEMGYLRKEKEN